MQIDTPRSDFTEDRNDVVWREGATNRIAKGIAATISQRP